LFPRALIRAREQSVRSEILRIQLNSGVKLSLNLEFDVMKEAITRKIRDGIISFVISAVGVGGLVGNAYVVNNIGYPKGLDYIGFGIMMGSLVFAVLPGIPLLILAILGLEIPLRGRESFIELNIGLWIYFVIFYSFLIYFLLQYRRKRQERRMLTANKNRNRSSGIS